MEGDVCGVIIVGLDVKIAKCCSSSWLAGSNSKWAGVVVVRTARRHATQLPHWQVVPAYPATGPFLD